MSANMGRFRRTLERVRSEPGLGRNVTVLITLVVLAAVSGGIILGKQRVNWPWKDHFTFYAAFEDAPGVSAGHGQEVRIAGVPVGQIDGADVDNDGHAKLKMSIKPKYKVYDNARLVLRPKSPVNEMYVELSPGGPPGHVLHSGGKLPITNTQNPVEIDQALGHLDASTRSALSTLLSQSDTALAGAEKYLPAGLQSTDVLTKKLAPVMEKLNTRRNTLRKLVTSLQDISTAIGGDDKRLSRLATSLERTLNATGEGSNALNSSLAQLPDLMSQLKDATDAVQDLSTQLDPTLNNLKTASAKLPGTLGKVTKTLDQAKKTVAQVKPVVSAAVPVVADLRPLVDNLATAVPDVKAVTASLDPITSALVKYKRDVAAFFANTHSIFSLKDANFGILRGIVEITPSMVPPGILPKLSNY